MPARDIMEIARDLRIKGEPFALATVVRTVAATAAKAGAKAVVRPDGTISEGWIGGGCARAAVLRSAREAIADGKPRLISVQPKDLLGAQGVKSGDERDGIRFASNMCPSKGTMDIFIEPVVPRPELVIVGSSPVAVALAELGGRFGFRRIVVAPTDQQAAFGEAEERIEGYALPVAAEGRRYIVVATQGNGDEAGLRAALSVPSAHVAFVGSRAKGEALRARLAEDGVEAAALQRLKCPAGLDIGAITPDEIALSILAETVLIARRGDKA
jgi:xanthine dehydrogenase accessory factor